MSIEKDDCGAVVFSYSKFQITLFARVSSQVSGIRQMRPFR